MEKAKVQLSKRVSIIQWLPKYTKNDIFADLIAGLTVGLTMMPQSIAYAGLAGLPAQYGLYTAFIGSFTYIFVGTIKEVSIGPTSLMSLLTFSYTVGQPIEYVILLTFIAGCVELLMGILQLGFLVDFISPCLTSGFTSASTLIIISAQIKNLVGINIKSHNFVSIMKELTQKYNQLRLADTVMGFTCIGILLIFKNMNKFIKTDNPVIKKFLWLLSISKNAIVVLVATIVAACWSTDGVTPFVITGNVPKGIPEIKFPSFSSTFGNTTVGLQDMVESLGSGTLIVPFVAVVSNVAIAKSYSANSVIDASQEMISLGLANIFGSFVKAMPSSGAFTRSAVASNSDVRTPLQGLYSGAVIVLALSFLAPYFYFIPKAALGAVLITAVSSLFDYEIFPVLWRCNKMDFFLTLGTLIVGVLNGVEAAIIIGAAFNSLILLKVWARPNVAATIIERPDSQHGKSKYLLVKPELGLYYPGADSVSECIKKHRGENPDVPIVLDCINIIRLDYAAAKTLENLLDSYNETEINLVIINMKEEIMNKLKTVMDPDYTKWCSGSNDIPEIVVIHNTVPEVEEKEEEHTLLSKHKERKMSKISTESGKSIKGDRKMSITSFKGERRRSSIAPRNLERKRSIYDLE